MRWTEGIEYKSVDDGYNLIVESFENCGIKGVTYSKPSGYIELYSDGGLILSEKYWWNGSNCSIDTDTNIGPSAFHDAGYWLLDNDIIPNTWGNRKKIDKMFYKLCRKAGMRWCRARYFYRGVRTFGWLAC